jgi:hypothetical protein
MRSGVSLSRLNRGHLSSRSTMSLTPAMEFSHAKSGMTRFPPNIEQLRIERDATVTWLIARRNDVELRFPLHEDDRRHLARLLLGDLQI